MSILFLIFNSAVGFFLTGQHSSSSSAAQHTSPRKKKREQQQHGEWKESKSWKLKLYCWIMKNSTWNHNKRRWKLSRVSFVSQLKSVFFSDLLKCASLAGHWAERRWACGELTNAGRTMNLFCRDLRRFGRRELGFLDRNYKFEILSGYFNFLWCHADGFKATACGVSTDTFHSRCLFSRLKDSAAFAICIFAFIWTLFLQCWREVSIASIKSASCYEN